MGCTTQQQCPIGQVLFYSPIPGSIVCLLCWEKLISAKRESFAPGSTSKVLSCFGWSQQYSVFDGGGGHSIYDVFGDLWRVNLSVKLLSWQYVPTAFASPEPRYWHSMSNLGQFNLLFGG